LAGEDVDGEAEFFGEAFVPNVDVADGFELARHIPGLAGDVQAEGSDVDSDALQRLHEQRGS
jgi:hypothetical protein